MLREDLLSRNQKSQELEVQAGLRPAALSSSAYINTGRICGPYFIVPGFLAGAVVRRTGRGVLMLAERLQLACCCQWEISHPWRANTSNEGIDAGLMHPTDQSRYDLGP